MSSKRKVSPLIATIILALSGIATAGLLGMWDIGSTKPAIYKLEITAAHLVEPVSVENSGWQIKLMISNAGKQDAILNKIYVDEREVSENGLIHGEKLSSIYTIGSSLAESGAFIQPGRCETVYIWIGSEAFRKGDTLAIVLQHPDQLALRTTLTLS